MKATPASRKLACSWASVGERLTPSTSSTSAEPALLRERLPCLATIAPAPAATMATAVDVLSDVQPMPPVPHVSMAPSGASTLRAWARITRAPATMSSEVSPRVRRPIRNAAMRAGSASPARMASKAAVMSVGVGRRPSASRLIALRTVSLNGGPPSSGSWQASPCRIESRWIPGGTARRRRGAWRG